MAIPYAGTQIGPDGTRYTTGQIPEGLAYSSGRLASVHGTPAGAQVVWWNPATARAEWVNLDTVEDFFPLSS